MSHLSIDERKTLEILIVDDDRIVRMLHRHTLERCNLSHSIMAFADGKEAIDYLREQHHPEKNYLVLLDINMPVMNGWEFLEECHIAGCAENIYAVMVSSSINIGDKIKAEKFPKVVDFLEKPISPKSVAKIRGLRELRSFFEIKESER